MHRLGDVGRRVVDDQRLARAGLREAEERVGLHGFEMAREGVVGEGEVDEAGAGDFGLGEKPVRGELRDDLFGEDARRQAQGFGGGHGGVALVVAERFVGHGKNAQVQRGQVGVGERRREGLADQIGQHLLKSLHNSLGTFYDE